MPTPLAGSTDYVQRTGLYLVTHANGPHRAEHEIFCTRGGHFPTCRSCGKQPIFELVREVPIYDEWTEID